MAKKKQTKKHRFKYAEPTTGVTASIGAKAASSENGSTDPLVARTKGAVVDGHSFDYVRRDIRRLGILAASLIGFELILWWVFGHTGLGTSVYSSVHL